MTERQEQAKNHRECKRRKIRDRKKFTSLSCPNLPEDGVQTSADKPNLPSNTSDVFKLSGITGLSERKPKTLTSNTFDLIELIARSMVKLDYEEYLKKKKQ